MSGILHNRYLLYTVFIIALVDFLYLGSIRDMTSVFVFVLIGLLVSFFHKNMIIVLSSTMIVTNVLKYGGINQKLVVEGFEDGEDDDEDDSNKKPTEEPTTKKPTEEPTTKKPTEEPTAKPTEEPTKKPTEEPTAKSKEEFGQDKQVVYTSVDDMAMNDQDKMMLANEKLLERMNKYKPLLDTLQGLTKNMAIMKGIATSANELKADIAKDVSEKKPVKE